MKESKAAYLACINRQEFWNKTYINILLGDWCIDQNTDINSFSTTSPISVWDHPDQLKYGASKVREYHNVLLAELTCYLNMQHGENHSSLYWKILIGPWLYRFVANTYDKYMHLKKALQKYGAQYELHAYVIDEKDCVLVADTNSYRALIQSDFFQMQIISDLMKCLDIRDEPVVFKKDYLKKYYKMCINKSRGPIINEQYTGDADILINLFSRITVKPSIEGITIAYYTKNEQYYNSYNTFNIRRPDLLSEKEDDDDFMKVIKKMILQYLPFTYLEGYKDLHDKAIKEYLPKIIINEDWNTDEYLKILSALVYEQHGCLIAVNPNSALIRTFQNNYIEMHELSLCNKVINRFFYPLHKKIYVLPDGREKKHIKNKIDDRILFISGGFHQPHIIDFILQPKTNFQINDYYMQQVIFTNLLRPELKHKLLYKPHPVRFRKEKIQNIKNCNIEICSVKDLDLAITQAKIVVMDHVSTSFFSILQSDVPFILYWDKNLWTLTSESMSILHSFEKAGIFFDSPTSAASALNSIYDDIESWWHEPKRAKLVQTIRNAVIVESTNTESEFEKILIDLCNEQGLSLCGR